MVIRVERLVRWIVRGGNVWGRAWRRGSKVEGGREEEEGGDKMFKDDSISDASFMIC